jgi:hypothetical protein
MVVLAEDLDGDIPRSRRHIQYPAFEPSQLLDRPSSPIKISPQAEEMIEKIVRGGNIVEEVSNRFRMEKISLHRSFFKARIQLRQFS